MEAQVLADELRRDKNGTTWQEELYALLREHDITKFAFVPDAGHRHLIDTAIEDPNVDAIPLSTEEEGVGIIAGSYLAGDRGVLLIQSSGVGNIINFLSLVQHCQIPILVLVTMRGDYGEQNPWQFAMGRAVEKTLNAMDLITLRTDSPEDVKRTVEAALGMVNRGGRQVAVLLTQRLLGAKKF